MMKNCILLTTALLVLVAGAAYSATPGSLIITAEAAHGSPNSALAGQDILARVDDRPVAVESWHALRDDPGGFELWILIDDGTDSRVGTQVADIKKFIQQQPPRVKVAIGYLRNGSVETIQKPTADHEAAARKVRLPSGPPGISGSPYIALSDFLHHAPISPQLREIVLISSGIDPYYGPGPQNPYLQNAIQDSQKAGVPIYAIYFSSAGFLGHSYRQIDWGQNDLSELSEETGGEFYWQGTSNPVAFQPFFDNINRRFEEQYVMKLDAAKGSSGFQRLRLRTETLPMKLIGRRKSTWAADHLLPSWLEWDKGNNRCNTLATRWASCRGQTWSLLIR